MTAQASQKLPNATNTTFIPPGWQSVAFALFSDTSTDLHDKGWSGLPGGQQEAKVRVLFEDLGAELARRGGTLQECPAQNSLRKSPPAPLDTRTIVNAHFRLSGPVPMPGSSRIVGLVGGTAQWLFARDDLVSVTVSAADSLAEQSADDIAE